MRICFVCSEYPPGPHGGLGTLTQVLARALVRAGHQVCVVGVYPPSYAARADTFEDRGVVVTRLLAPSHKGGWIRARGKLYSTIRTWVRQGQVDLVEVPDYQGWSAGWPSLEVPVIVRLNGSATYFSNELGRHAGRTTRWIEWAALRRADAWISASRYLLQRTAEVFGLGPKHSAVVYNSVDVPSAEWQGAPRQPDRVVFAGTLTPKKGIISLIKAWPAVLRACPRARLDVYGKAADDVRAFVAEIPSMLGSAADTISFHGHVPVEQVEAAFQQARVAVLPSYAEGFALAPLHAMACGCATIYSRRGSGPELIDHGHNGLLVEPDRPEEIADAVIRLLRDDAFAERLGRAGRAHVAHYFSVEALLAMNEAFYQKVLERYPGATNRHTMHALRRGAGWLDRGGRRTRQFYGLRDRRRERF